MNKIFLIIFLFLHIFCVGQQIQTEFVKPTSPEVYNLYKYSETPVSEFSGSVNLSIPIYTIDLGDFSWPITLSYRSTGVKVEELATCYGLNWSLNATGYRSTRVCGLNDEITAGFPHSNFVLNETNAYDPMGNPSFTYANLNEQNKYNHYTAVAEGNEDAQPDLTFFNLGNISGKYFQDQYGQYHTIPLTNIKVTNDAIYDESGVKYVFGTGDFYDTKNCPNDSYSPPNWSNTGFLSAITTRYGRWINFEYENASYTYDHLNVEIKSRLLSGKPRLLDDPTTFSCPQTSTKVDGSFIKKITTSKGDIISFVYDNTSRKDLPGSKILQSIIISNSYGTLVKKLNFQYAYAGIGPLGVPTSNRLMLTSIEQEMANGQKITLYQFEYDRPELMPDRLSKSQDFWGFYNGAHNETLLPSNFDMNFVGANREVAFDYAKIGSLKKVIYPTGGYSIFEYEPNDVYLNNEMTETIGAGQSPQFNSVANQTVSYSVTIPTNAVYLNLYHELWNCGNQSNPPGGQHDDEGELPPNADNCKIEFSGNGYYYIWDCTSIKENNFFVDLPAGTYNVTVTTQGSQVSGFLQLRYMLRTVEYFTGNKITGGLRIKQVSTFAAEGDLPQIAKYTYRKFNAPDQSSGKQIASVNSSYYQSKWHWFSSNYGYWDDLSAEVRGDVASLIPAEVKYLVQKSNPVISLQTEAGDVGNYENVTKFIDGNGTMGKTEYTFSIAGLDAGDYGFPFTPRGSFDYKNGKLLKQIVYGWKGSYYPIESTENFYSERPYENFWNKLYSDQSNVPDFYKGLGLNISYKLPRVVINLLAYDAQFTVGFYHWYSKWYRLDKTTHKLYTGENAIEETTNYAFNSPYHLQVSDIITKNSKGDDIAKSMIYPSDKPSDPILTKLKNANCFVPFSTSTSNLSKNALLETTSTTFKEWSNNIIAPLITEKVLSNQRPALRMNYSAYDNYGNILEMSKQDNVKQVAVYGYNKSVPVALVTNSSYAIVSQTIDQGILDNPSSDQVLRAELDKLRTISGALVTTYTYSPLIGITSQTDPNGRTTYFEYDTMGRLALIKDQDGNIVKTFEYNYKH
ncbi:RHS repeat protein [Chitinophagaceae bacterium 26-R-25]|nr:RHS repeat protein [Chitinophagaceae bacterium 26-R-25]